MSILYTLISQDPNHTIYEYTEYEGDVKRISHLALQNTQKNKKIYRRIGEYLGCYINRNDITYFCISQNITQDVAFSFLDDLEAKFLKEFRETVESSEIITIDQSKDSKMEKILKDLVEFYEKNPKYNKSEKIIDQFNKALETIKENEIKLLERDNELESIFKKAESINDSSQKIHFKSKRLKKQERRRRMMCFIFTGCFLLVSLILVLWFFFSNDKK